MNERKGKWRVLLAVLAGVGAPLACDDTGMTTSEDHCRGLAETAAVAKKKADAAEETAAEALRIARETKKDKLSVKLLPITEGNNGHSACNEQGYSCVAVVSSKTYSMDTGEFWGYSSFSCGSKVSAYKHCGGKKGFDWRITGERFTRSKDSKVAGSSTNGYLCLSAPSYSYVVCASPELPLPLLPSL